MFRAKFVPKAESGGREGKGGLQGTWVEIKGQCIKGSRRKESSGISERPKCLPLVPFFGLYGFLGVIAETRVFDSSSLPSLNVHPSSFLPSFVSPYCRRPPLRPYAVYSPVSLPLSFLRLGLG